MRCFCILIITICNTCTNVSSGASIYSPQTPQSIVSLIKTGVLINYVYTLRTLPNYRWRFISYMDGAKPNPDAKLSDDGKRLTFCGMFPSSSNYGTHIIASVKRYDDTSFGIVNGKAYALELKNIYRWEQLGDSVDTGAERWDCRSIGEFYAETNAALTIPAKIYLLRGGFVLKGVGVPEDLIKATAPYITNTCVLDGNGEDFTKNLAWYFWPNVVWGRAELSYIWSSEATPALSQADNICLSKNSDNCYTYSFLIRRNRFETIGASGPFESSYNELLNAVSQNQINNQHKNIDSFFPRMIAKSANGKDYIFYFSKLKTEIIRIDDSPPMETTPSFKPKDESGSSRLHSINPINFTGIISIEKQANMMLCRNSSGGALSYDYGAENIDAITNFAERICVDTSGNVYTANLISNNFVIWKYKSSGVFSSKIEGATSADTIRNIDLFVLQNGSTAIPCLLIDYKIDNKIVLGIRPTLGQSSLPEYIFADYVGSDHNNAKIVHNSENIIVANRVDSNNVDLYFTKYKITGKGTASKLRVFSKKFYPRVISDCEKIVTMELKNNHLWITYMTKDSYQYKYFYVDATKLY